MNRVLALVDDSPCAADVRQTAAWIADLLGATVDAIQAQPSVPEREQHVDGSSQLRMVEGPTIEVLLRELAAHDVETGVVGSRAIEAKPQLLGHIAEALLTSASGPLVVVPPETAQPPAGTPHVLVPLDGNEDTTAALLPLATHIAAAGAAISIAHVYDAESLPPYIASSEDIDILASELAKQHLPGIARHCELRIGDPATEVLGVVHAEHPDAVMVAWHQKLTPARAEVMRRLLNDAHIPLVVTPVGPTNTPVDPTK